MIQWRIRKENDNDFLEIWNVSEYSESTDPDEIVEGTKGQFKYTVKGNSPCEVIESPDEIEGESQMLATVDNRDLPQENA